MKKRVLTGWLCICMIMTMQTVITFGSTKSNTNTSGTVIIRTLEDLQDFRDTVNGLNGKKANSYAGKTVKLAADIDMSDLDNWTPIGTTEKPFMGVFDGNNKTLSGLKISADTNYQGLFGYVKGTSKNRAQIKNLTMEKPVVTGRYYAAAVVGCYYGKYTAPLTNCIVEDGQITGIRETIGGKYVGGVAGYAGGNVVNCHTSGTVIGGRAGGVVGEAFRNVSDCTSSCTVKSNAQLFGTIGGIGSTIKGDISNCYATGDITDESNGATAGGLVAIANGSIADSYATGNVNAREYVGGLAAQANKGISNCYATGNVTGEEYVGGLAGYASYYKAIENSYAAGDVLGNRYVGGLIGVVASDYDIAGEVINCYATGDVSGNAPMEGEDQEGISGSNIGGLIGYTGGKVNNCYAMGNVLGQKYVGGIVGQKDGFAMINCVALNPGIQGESYTHRITGVLGEGYKLSGNYAGEGMTVNDAVVTAGTSADNEDGANLSASGALNPQIWTIFKGNNQWNFTKNQLPTLKKVGGIQSSQLPEYIKKDITDNDWKKAPLYKLTAGNNSIKISWQQTSGVSGYRIYRCTSKTGTYKLIKVVGSDVNSYTSYKLKDKKTYFYKIRTYKVVDGKNTYGSYATVKSCKTK